MNFRIFIAGLCLFFSGAGTAHALNAVDSSPNLEWLCEEGLSISIAGDKLQVRMEKPAVEEVLTLYGCQSSHCTWQTTGTGTECDYEEGAPLCASITAGPKGQIFDISGRTSKGIPVDATCVTIKNREYWTE